MGRLRNLWQSFTAFWSKQAFSAPPATRVGMLNTGELALVDGQGVTQVLSVGTTELIRATLERNPPTPRLSTALMDDTVHSLLRQAAANPGTVVRRPA